MSDLVTRMDIALHDRVQRIQNTIKTLKTSAVSEAHDLEDGFYDKIHEIEDVLKNGRERVSRAAEKIDDMALETLSNVLDWRAEREHKKLEKEAEKSKHYAEAAIDVAIGALDEAEWALSRAFMTKSLAENVADD